MPDRLSTLYHDLLDGTYDCVDRIVLNAYFRPGHGAGGFRVWWRRLTGSDASLDNAHLMRLAGRFSRRVRAAYDLKRLRGKQLVQRIDGTRRFQAPASGLKTLTTVTVLRTHVIKPLLAAAERTGPGPSPQQSPPLDRRYDALRTGMHGVFHELGIAA